MIHEHDDIAVWYISVLTESPFAYVGQTVFLKLRALPRRSSSDVCRKGVSEADEMLGDCRVELFDYPMEAVVVGIVVVVNVEVHDADHCGGLLPFETSEFSQIPNEVTIDGAERFRTPVSLELANIH